MLRLYTAVLFFLICYTGVAAQKANAGFPDSLGPADLKPVGRFRLSDSTGLELISTAAHFGFRFAGSSCAVYFSLPDAGGHNYLQYEVDGTYRKRIMISAGNNNPVTITATGKGRHKVEIYKTTEASSGPVFITGIKGKAAESLSPSAAPLIEFIGNSITCGAAADTSSFPCSAGGYHDHHNAYMAYGPRVARALGADYLVSSVSGIGIYRTWNLDSPSMPQVYQNTDLRTGSPDQWNFPQFRPHIVSIALGTNDMSNGDGKTPRKPFDSAVFVSEYVKFVVLVRTKYPAARILLLSSPMIKGEKRKMLEDCLLDVSKQINAHAASSQTVSTYFFKTGNTHGCGGHPSVADHGLMAKELIPVFRRLMSPMPE